MRYHIDTIPVWDAYHEESECPLCVLAKKCEESYVDNFLGASVMEPDVRIEVNAKGFCGDHFAQMIEKKNRLGLALMTHTHLQKTFETMKNPMTGKKKRFGKKEAAEPLTHPGDSCVICERIDQSMKRYLFTVLHLWKTDSTFKTTLESSKGLCLPHYQALMQMGAESLHGAQAEEFAAMMEALQRENMQRIEKELEWFTLKFDYRNADAPWGNSKDALERAINKLRGKTI